MSHAGKTGRPASAVYFIIAAAVFAVLLVSVLTIIRSDSAGRGADTEVTNPPPVIATTESADDGTEVVTDPVLTVTSEESTEAVPPETTDTDTSSSEASSETEITTPPVTEPTTESPAPVVTNPPAPPPLTPTDQSRDFSGTLFIGDSRTVGLMLFSGVTGATAYAESGLTTWKFFSAECVTVGDQKITPAAALAAQPNFERIYVMLGLNELRWENDGMFYTNYARFINYLKETAPQAEIIVQPILPITAQRETEGDIFTNARIAEHNEIIIKLCDDFGLQFMDVRPGLCDSTGALPAEATFDGIHMNQTYCARWLDYMAYLAANR